MSKNAIPNFIPTKYAKISRQENVRNPTRLKSKVNFRVLYKLPHLQQFF